MSAAVVTRRGRAPRARHDAGVEPLDWMRVVLVLALIGLASGGALATAGVLRQGPLEMLGWTDRQRAALEYAGEPEDRVVRVLVRLPESACAQRLVVEVRETEKTVELGLHSREPRFTLPPCTPVSRPAGQEPVAVARLDEPLGPRRVLVNGVAVRAVR